MNHVLKGPLFHLKNMSGSVMTKRKEKLRKTGENCRSIFVIRTNETFFLLLFNTVFIPLLESKEQNIENHTDHEKS